MDEKQLASDLRKMNWSGRYAHLVTALHTAMTTEKGSPSYNEASKVIRAHYKAYQSATLKKA